MSGQLCKAQQETREEMVIVGVALAATVAVARLLAGKQRFGTMVKRTVYASAIGTGGGLLAGVAWEMVEPDNNPMDTLAGCTTIGAWGTPAATFLAHMIASVVRR